MGQTGHGKSRKLYIFFCGRGNEGHKLGTGFFTPQNSIST